MIFCTFDHVAFIFSIDEKTKQKNLGKINAKQEAGTRTHVFYRSTHKGMLTESTF
jgi:hypothetical protein